MDEHANIAAMDPAKLPAIRAQIWTLIQAAQLDHDLGLDDRPHDAEFDDFLLHVDGWLCEIKDAQIRDGLHVLGAAPAGRGPGQPGAVDPARQPGLGRPGATPCRACAPRSVSRRTGPDTARSRRRRGRAPALSSRPWRRSTGSRPPPAAWSRRPSGTRTRSSRRSWTFAATQVVPRLARTTDELDAVLHALDGGYVPAGPSGSPLRGLVNVLPTGRNFYTVDPKAVPVPARLRHRPGDGRLAGGAVRRRHRHLPALGRPVGLGHVGDAHVRRRHRRGARADRRPAAVAGGVPARRLAWRSVPLEELGSPSHRRHGAHLRLLPRRVPARRTDARRRVHHGRRPRRAGRSRTTCARTPSPTSPSTATCGGRPPGSSAPSRARTAPGCCR